MPSLLDPTDELISPEERKAITQQSVFNSLLQLGPLLAAAGGNMTDWQRAQMLGQVAQTVGGMPGNQQQGLQSAAQQKLLGQKYAEKKQQDAFLKSEEFQNAVANMSPEYQALAKINPVQAFTNWRQQQVEDKRQAAMDDRADKRAQLELQIAQMKRGEPIVREVGGQIYRVYQDGRPAELIQTNGGKPIDNSLRDDLNKSVTPMRGLMSLGNDFKDEYAGYKSGTVGDIVNLYGRNVASSDSDIGKQAQWWQSYQEFANLKRNALFGSALTATEKTEFDKAMINPGMSPSQIRENLQKQQDIAKSAVSRIANSAKESGINPKALESLIGMSFDDLGSPMTKPAPAVQNNPQGVGNIPAAAINHLRQNPGLREAFDQKYGAGASARVLGQ